MKIHYGRGPYYGDERTACSRKFTTSLLRNTTLVMANVTCKRCLLIEQMTYGRIADDNLERAIEMFPHNKEMMTRAASIKDVGNDH